MVMYGDYNGRVNGLNIKTDVLHAGNVDTAVITGKKTFHTLDVDNLHASHINGIDMNDWLQNAVRTNTHEEQFIDGHVEFRKPVFTNDVWADGPVNGIMFTPETILTKSGEGQVINGNVILETMTTQEIKPSFVEQLYLNYGINDKNLTNIYMNTFKSGDQRIESNSVTFDKTVLTGFLDVDKNIYDVNIGEFLKKSETSNKMIKFQNNLEHLMDVGRSLKESFNDEVVELNHFEHHQSLFGVNLLKTVPLTIRTHDGNVYIFAVHERNTNKSLEVIRFFKWDRETQLFAEDASMIPLQFSLETYEVTKLDKVVYKGSDHLFMEMFDKSKQEFDQSLLTLDVQSKAFIAYLVSSSKVTAQFFTINDGSAPCYGSAYRSHPNLNIICEGTQPTILQTPPVMSVSSSKNLIILLTEDQQVQVWYQQKISKNLNVLNPQSFTSIEFNGKFYIAVTTDITAQSIHQGSIEVFESDDGTNFKLLQSFEKKNPFSVQFSVIPSGDLLMYTLTMDPEKNLRIFKYAGASNFVEITDETIIKAGHDLSTIRIDDSREFVAIVSKTIRKTDGEVLVPEQVYIVETVLKKY